MYSQPLCEHDVTRCKAMISLFAMVDIGLHEKTGGWKGTCLDY